jgi:hypothetical protein
MRRNKKNLLTVFTALLLLCAGTTAQARSWRINNDTSKKAHFTDINAAMSSSEVVADDTLYIDPGTTLTGTQNVTKRVTIIGTGYFLNNGMKAAAISATIYLSAANIKIEGLEMTGTVVLAANNITLERCKIGSISYSGTAQNAAIRQCYIPNGQISGAGMTNNRTSNWIIENCIIIHTNGYDPIINLYRPLIRNNYARPNFSSASASIAHVSGATIVNNIFINTKFIGNAELYDVTDCTVSNNVFHVASYSTTYPGNIIIANNKEETVFALEGTNDQLYRLKEDSPAKGAATDGGDCGPYSGLYPYVPSGYPLGMPRFESSSVPVRPQDGQVRVTQKVVLQGE